MTINFLLSLVCMKHLVKCICLVIVMLSDTESFKWGGDIHLAPPPHISNHPPFPVYAIVKVCWLTNIKEKGDYESNFLYKAKLFEI